jgi:uncharacterized protein involved in copper resistance
VKRGTRMPFFFPRACGIWKDTCRLGRRGIGASDPSGTLSAALLNTATIYLTCSPPVRPTAAHSKPNIEKKTVTDDHGAAHHVPHLHRRWHRRRASRRGRVRPARSHRVAAARVDLAWLRRPIELSVAV